MIDREQQDQLDKAHEEFNREHPEIVNNHHEWLKLHRRSESDGLPKAGWREIIIAVIVCWIIIALVIWAGYKYNW